MGPLNTFSTHCNSIKNRVIFIWNEYELLEASWGSQAFYRASSSLFCLLSTCFQASFRFSVLTFCLFRMEIDFDLPFCAASSLPVASVCLQVAAICWLKCGGETAERTVKLLPTSLWHLTCERPEGSSSKQRQQLRHLDGILASLIARN